MYSVKIMQNVTGINRMTFAEPPGSPRRVLGFVAVILLHLAIVYALVTGLARQAIEVVRAPIETRIIDAVKTPPPDTAALPPPKLAPPPPAYIPPPEIQIARPASTNAISVVTDVKPPVAMPAPPASVAPIAEPVRVRPVIDAARSCRQPEYPSVSRRLEESGVVVLQFLVEVDGSVVESKVETSSGFARLDEAARATLSLCRFKAGTVDGKPERSWARLRYVWKLE
jgi:protein TonB